MTETRLSELRYLPAPPEVRKSMTGMTIGGYAAKFSVRSHNLGNFIEVVEPQAFRKSESDGFPGTTCKYQHDDNMLLGTTAAGTLRIAIDKVGVDYTCDLPECRADVFEMISRKDVQHSSFAMQVYDQQFERGDNGVPVRHLLQCRLLDCSPVTSPAYPDATVALRSLAAQFEIDPEEVFQLNRDNELRKLFERTDVPILSGREALKQVGRTKQGRQALMESLAAKPIDARLRRAEAMAAEPVSGAERLAQAQAVRDPVKAQIAALQVELAEARAYIAKLSDPVAIEREASQRAMDLADERARDEIDRQNGTLSGAAAMRLLEEARPAGCAPYVPPAPEAEESNVPRYLADDSELMRRELDEARAEIERLSVPRTMDPHEALRQLEAMRPAALYVEAPVNRGRASDSYLSELGGRY
jgi:HK97 family phage prohead protease